MTLSYLSQSLHFTNSVSVLESGDEKPVIGELPKLLFAIVSIYIYKSVAIICL